MSIATAVVALAQKRNKTRDRKAAPVLPIPKIALVRPMILKDYTGRSFGKLAVESMVRRNGVTYACCRCVCGECKDITPGNLNSGFTVSCGCVRRARLASGDMRRTHGDRPKQGARKGVYVIWCNMRARCENENHHAYHRYGGRGITVCDEWNNYETFRAWARATGYAPGLTIDREDNNGHYCPTNCGWLSRANNSRKARGATL